ncbi:MAG: hypothetical protein SPG27_10115 [Butyricimonas virosa]|nr:hypothetical protein [Butyricimonas virosa]
MAKITYMLKGVILVMVLALGSCTKWNYHDGGLSDGVHDCSMWEYFHTQPHDWDSTMIMIEHAGLKELFEGRGEHEQITFFGVTNLSILNYMLQNGYKRVIDIPVEDCKNILCKLIVPKRLMVNDIPRGQIVANTGEKVDGMETQTLRGSVFMWTHQEPYMQIEEAGEVSLYIRTNSGLVSFRVVSTDIQTNNGVVQAMGYAFDLNKI